MPDGTVDFSGIILPKPRTAGLLMLALIVVIVGWGTFVIIPAGHRGVVLLWGSVEKRIMGEGLNFKTPMAESVIKVDVKVQPHPFKEIDASSKEYQVVKMTGMMNFHIDPGYVNDLYQKVGLDFADKVIDPAFNDFVKEVVPPYPITLPTSDSRPGMKARSRPSRWPNSRWKPRNRFWPNARSKRSKRSPRQRGRRNRFSSWPKARPRPMTSCPARSARSSCSIKGSRNGMGFYRKSPEELYPSST
ncbi:MAG: SPFH domain-containing protein [candidate division NC10 bacterium]|nr:SPFH domain-containing protein [candidate division NC10 bacterium]